MAERLCSNCKTTVTPSANFCSNCGTALKPVNDESASGKNNVEQQLHMEKAKTKAIVQKPDSQLVKPEHSSLLPPQSETNESPQFNPSSAVVENIKNGSNNVPGLYPSIEQVKSSIKAIEQLPGDVLKKPDNIREDIQFGDSFAYFGKSSCNQDNAVLSKPMDLSLKNETEIISIYPAPSELTSFNSTDRQDSAEKPPEVKPEALAENNPFAILHGHAEHNSNPENVMTNKTLSEPNAKTEGDLKPSDHPLIQSSKQSSKTEIERNEGANKHKSTPGAATRVSGYIEMGVDAAKFKVIDEQPASQNNSEKSATVEVQIVPNFNRFADRRCRTVRFAVLLPFLDFKFDPTFYQLYIMFGHNMLGEFTDLYYPLKIIGQIADEYLVMGVNVLIPYEINNTEYKYMTAHKFSDIQVWELLHQFQSTDANRTLRLSHDMAQEVYRFDGCIQPAEFDLKSHRFKRSLRAFESFFNVSNLPQVFKKTNFDLQVAFNFFMPSWSLTKLFHVVYDLENCEKRLLDKLTVDDVVGRIEHIMHCFSMSFFSSFNYCEKEFFWTCVQSWFKNTLKIVMENYAQLIAIEKTEAGCILLHVAHIIRHSTRRSIPADQLLNICKLFAYSEDSSVAKYQKDNLSKIQTFNVKEKLFWLISYMDLTPESLVALPLYNSLVTNAERSNNVEDTRWWLTSDKNLERSRYSGLDWGRLNSVLVNYPHLWKDDNYFVRYLLIKYCYDSADVKRLHFICTPDLILAWCVYRAMRDEWIVKGQRCRGLTELLEIVGNTLYIVDSAQHHKELTETLSKLIFALSPQLHIGKENVQFLMKILEIADLLGNFQFPMNNAAAASDLNKFPLLLTALEKLLSYNADCFILSPLANDNDWNNFFHCLKWKGKDSDQSVTNIWLNVIVPCIERLSNEEYAYYRLLEIFCMDDFEMFHECIQKKIEALAIDKVEHFLRDKNAAKKFWDKVRDTKRISVVLSLVFVRMWPKENVSDVDILMHIAKSPFLCRYFDKSYMNNVKVLKECQDLLSETKRCVINFTTACSNGQITLSELKRINCEKQLFLDVLNTISGKKYDSFETIVFQTLLTVMNQFETHQSNLRKLRPFISIVKIDESKLFSKILSYELNAVRISDIADKTDNGSFKFSWTLPAGLLEALDRLHSVNDNQIFLYYWHARCKSLTEKIALSEFLDLVYIVVVEQIKECVEMLKDSDISVEELEVVLGQLPSYPVMYFANELRSLCKNLLDISGAWVDAFDEKLMLYDQLKKNSTTNKVLFSLVQKLNLTNVYAELKQIASFAVQQNKVDLKLRDLNSDLIENAILLSTLTSDQLKCLSAADEYFELIKWAREKNEKDLPKFVDIAYSNVGESDADYAMITDFNNVIVGFNCLIYNVPEKCDLKSFFAQLHRLWETLERNPNLAKQLEYSFHNRHKLEALWQAAGDLQKSSLDEIEKINRIGVYRIGDINKTVSKKTVDNCIELELPNENGPSEIVNMTKLRDLHSRVMLMGTRMEKSQTSKQQIDHFALIFDAVTRLASLYVQHFEAGNILFIEWRCLLDNNPRSDLQATCYVSTIDRLISGEKDEHLTVLEQIDALCSFFEISLKDWHDYVEKLRHNFPALNYFTNKQIEYLRKALASIGKKFDPKAALMLLVLNPSASHDQLKSIVTTCTYDSNNDKSELEKFNDYQQNIIRPLTDDGFSLKFSILAATKVDFASVDAAKEWAIDNMDTEKSQSDQTTLTRDLSFTNQLNEMVKILETSAEKLLANKLETLWNKHLSANESGSSYTEFVGVRHLGQILSEIAAMSPTGPELNFRGVKLNEPNLFVVHSLELYRFVLSLYTHVGGSKCLPSFETVLMCNEDTSVESVSLFIRRLSSSGGKKFYSIVAVDQLKTEVSAKLEIILEDLLKSGRKFCLALIADESRFIPSSNYLSRYLAKYNNLDKWMDTKHFLHKHLLRSNHKEIPNVSTLPAEFCLSYFKSVFFTSVGYGHGKSQAVSVQRDAFPDAVLVKIPIHGTHFSCDDLYDLLATKDCLIDPHNANQRIIHIDILNHQTTGIDKMLFQLFILGGFTTTMGSVWRLLETDSYAIEMTSMPNRLLSMQPDVEELPEGKNFRFLLPTCLCHSPNVSYKLAVGDLYLNMHTANRSLNEYWINEDATQICYQYLSGLAQNQGISNFSSEKILKILIEHCGIRDPSWAELRYFVTFLYRQLTACEQSPFCHAGADLPGFNDFAVKFLIQMSRDFSTRSLEISEDVSSLIQDRLTEVEAYQIKEKQKWEYKAHPYIFLNDDQRTFSFFGCNLNSKGDLIDPLSEKVIENGAKIASSQLMEGLKVNGVDDLQQKFDDKSRRQKIEKMCMVFGVFPVDKDPDFNPDPDPSYEITSDCALKMLAIKMRFRCGIPVVIMGATGCGKTKLIEFMCYLERNGHLYKLAKNGHFPIPLAIPQNLIVVRVHGGTTKENIELAVNQALEKAHYNSEKFDNLPTVLLFDEANSTPYVSLIKEIMCDGTLNGRPLKLAEYCLNVIAAVNPYRKHSEEMVKKLENSGLGYHISATKVTEKFGNIPLRQLVYRVNPLPASMLPLVWDFGTLTSTTESLYIKQMVKRYITISKIEFPNDTSEDVINVLSKLLAEVQNWMHQQTDEAGFVSLRNVERTLKVIEWFYANGEALFKNNSGSKFALSVLMAISVCYRCSIQAKRQAFDDFAIKHFVSSLALPPDSVIVNEIIKCQETLLKNIDLPTNIAKNEALRENLFMMTLCIELRIPLFLVGKPGSSKSLAKTVVSENMCGPSSKSEIFKTLKQAVLVSFQCSPLATADGVETIFRQCARHQRSQNLNDYVAAAVFDEIGLAEDSPSLPLKALHGLLEVGCSIDGEEVTDAHRVAFVGISNWALDPAKMNRGIFVTRVDPTHRELLETAERICNKDIDNSVYNLVEPLVEPLTTAYLDVYKNQDRLFYGLRDFYSLMKMVYEVAEDTGKRPKYRQIMNAVRHNFSGQKDYWAYRKFDAQIAPLCQQNSLENVSISATMLIEENLNQSHVK